MRQSHISNPYHSKSGRKKNFRSISDQFSRTFSSNKVWVQPFLTGKTENKSRSTLNWSVCSEPVWCISFFRCFWKHKYPINFRIRFDKKLRSVITNLVMEKAVCMPQGCFVVTPIHLRTPFEAQNCDFWKWDFPEFLKLIGNFSSDQICYDTDLRYGFVSSHNHSACRDWDASFGFIGISPIARIVQFPP